MRFVGCLIVLVVIASGCTSEQEPAPTSGVSTTTTGTAAEGLVTTGAAAPEPTEVPSPVGGLATVVVRGGPVLTMDPAAPTAEAVAIIDDRIVAVGAMTEVDPYVGTETMLIDLEGRAVMPGFVDAHAHRYGRQLAEGLEPAVVQQEMLADGVTTVGEAGVDAGMLDELTALDDEGGMLVRTSLYLLHDNSCGEEAGDWILGIDPSRASGDRLHVGGVKVFTDGGSCNAPAVSYEHGFGGMGDLYHLPEEVAGIVETYEEAGFQVAIHALGDRAVEAALGGLEAVIGDSGNPLRHRIEHNAVVRPEMRGRYDEVGAVPVIFGSFATCAYLGRDDRFRFRPPIENQEWEWPWRDLLDLNPGTVFAWHSDFPIFADSTPVASLSGFVTRYQELDDGTKCEPESHHLKHAITVEEALQIMTMGSALALHRETEVGSIEVGKVADLVVLSADPTAVADRDLIDLEVELTLLNGIPVHCGAAFPDVCEEPPEQERVDDPPPSDAPPPGEVTASVSLATNPPEYAVDGDPDTHWGAGADAPQWIEVSLGGERQVTSVTLTVDQYPAGWTRHIIWGRLADGELVQLADLAGDTDILDVLGIDGDEPWSLTAIRIETVESPSWVSWREIEIGTVD